MNNLNQDRIIEYIRVERCNQDTKWGIQDHGDLYWLAILVEEVGEVAKVIIQSLSHNPQITHELIQCAAVIVAWLENIERDAEQE